MINSKAIGAGFALVLTSISAAQEAPTHHSFGTVNSGAGTRRSGPDGAGSGSGDADQQQPGTAGGDYFGGPPDDGHNDSLETGIDPSDLSNGGSNFPGAGGNHGEGHHGPDGFNGGFFGGGAGGFGPGSGAGGGSQGAGNDSQGQTGTGPDTGSAPPLFQAFNIPNFDSPPDDGDGNPPPSIFRDPPPPFGPSPQSPFGPPPPDGKDGPPPSGPNLKSDAVPEPFTLSLFGSGLAGAAALRRRRTKKA